MAQENQSELEQQSREPLVALIPPLLVPSPIMWRLYYRLKKQGRKAVIFRYQSYRRDIPDNAQKLAAFLRDLDEPVLDVITFSLGSILLRWASNHCELPPLRRVVMLGPPNQGAMMADVLHEKLGIGFPMIFGKSALQLRRGDRGLAARAGKLPSETHLGIIAGGKGNGKGFNPFIEGDDDRTVAVEETILSGMNDFVLINHVHAKLPLAEKSMNLAIKFLDTGRFRERRERNAPPPESDE